MRPIIIYENKAQALKYMQYWQSILSLDSWIIDIHLHYNHPVIAPAWGSSSIWRAIHTAEINIPMPYPGQVNTFPQRYCQELITVHELCHVRLPSIEVEVETTEGDFYEAESHATLECIAKGLIMAKYNINMEWFYNF